MKMLVSRSGSVMRLCSGRVEVGLMITVLILRREWTGCIMYITHNVIYIYIYLCYGFLLVS